MQAAAKSVPTLAEKNKVCMNEATTVAGASNAALPTILDAATVARSATAGD
jgi:hypothetical protein